MVDEIKWTVEALKEWARDLFATRDEAARVARDEVRREATREVNRLDETIAREVQIRDEQLKILRHDMDRRLSEERAFRDEVVGQALTRDTYEREHRALEQKIDGSIGQLDARISSLENMLANIQGKAVVYAIFGAIFLATITTFIGHLLNV